MKRYILKTFGCAMNYADSEKINMILFQSGFKKTNDIKEADLVIFNTCSVRQKGEDRVFGEINEIKKANKKREKKVIVGITGCMVRKTGLAEKYLQKENEKRKTAKKIELLKDKNGIFNHDDKLFPRSKELDFTLRIEEIKYLPFILTHIYKEKIGDENKYDDYLKSKQLRENPFSITTVIQTGCDNYCSFCIVPFTRGKELSRDKSEIIEEIKKGALSGAKEVNLVGQNVNSYGKQFVDKKLWNNEKGKWYNEILNDELKMLDKDNFKSKISNSKFPKLPFRELLEEIDKIDGIDRIRFTSSNPHDMTKDILDAHFELKHTCNYLHLALQSGSDEMLKKMNRKHSYKEFKNIVSYLRKKDPLFSISTDIIVGFSGETDEMFEETVASFKECVFDFAYIARYSVRPGTIASKMYPDNVSDELKSKRWHILNNLLLENIQERNKLILGREEEILIIGERDEQLYGRTRNFKEVFFEKKDGINPGDIVKVRLDSLDRYVIKGKIII